MLEKGSGPGEILQCDDEKDGIDPIHVFHKFDPDPVGEEFGPFRRCAIQLWQILAYRHSEDLLLECLR